MEWKQIDPADYNDTGAEPFYEINEMGQVRKIKNQKEIRLQTRDRYYLKNHRVNKSALLNKYYSKNIKVKAAIKDTPPALNLTGYEQLKNYSNYLIDRNGNVFSVQSNMLLKPNLNHFGYPQVGLCKNNKSILKRIHRLVAEQFIPNPRNYPVVNHIDGNRKNNHINNLEWCSHMYNSQTENTLRTPAQIKLYKYYLIKYKIAGKQMTETFKTEQEAIDANENLKEVMWDRQAKHYLVEKYTYQYIHNGKRLSKSSKDLTEVVDYKYNLLLQIKYANKFKQLINLK